MKFVMWAACLLFVGCAQEEPVEIQPTVPPPPVTQRPPTPPPAAPPTREEVGRSVENRPILLHRFGPAGAQPVLVIGGIHGNEQNAAELARLLVSELTAHPPSRPVIVLAEANPDGLSKNLRHNAHRVDLNRNFPAANWVRGPRIPYFGGATPGSEPETQALIRLIQNLHPRRILSLHSIVGEACNNFDGPAEPLARAMHPHNGYAVKANIGYPTPGSLGSWAGNDLGIPMITLELRRETPGREAWDRGNREAILAFVNAD